jgi:[protein-PII] uridylyltransferase
VGEGIEVLVFAPDDEALFARVCAFFARMGYSILSARIHTTRDGHVLDTFYALDPQQRQVAYRDILNYIEHELQLNLKQKPPNPEAVQPIPNGRLPRQLKAFPLSPTLSLVPSEQSRSHLLSFTAGDRPGLLANVAQVLYQHGVNVISARISTLGNRAEDIFVIHGEALDQQTKKLALEQDLLQTLRL